MFQTIDESVLIGVPISVKIEHSSSLSGDEKKKFLSLLSYFTPDELSDLRNLV